MSDNALYYGDNLDVMRRYLKDESVDLIYLDPPFNSNASYNMLFAEQDGSRAAAQIKAFNDTWRWDQASARAYQEAVEAGGPVSLVMQAFRQFLGENDMLAYLAMMAPRLMELKRVLKPTGSIYLHCDPTASHYLKLLMDAAFGPKNYQNEVIWKRTSAHSGAKRYGPIHDTLLFYSKTDNYVWKPQYQPYEKEYIDTFFDQEDSDGKHWKRTDLTAPEVRHGDSGKKWREIDVTAKGRHWAIPGEIAARLGITDGTIQEKLDALDKSGRIHWPKKKDGMPRLKQYPEDLPGVPLQDVISDIPPMHNLASERLHYPTQKPLALLKRIMLPSSNPGDTVLDPFCGCGTAVDAAQELGRRWIGIDITPLAITAIKGRLFDKYGASIKQKYVVVGEPTTLPDAKQLAEENPYHFQYWSLGLVGARPAEEKKGADKGIDGRLFFHDESESGKTKQIILSVKAGNIKPAYVSELRGVIEREKAVIGVLITMEEPTKAMRTEAASADFYISPFGKYPRLQILTIADLLSGKGIDYPTAAQRIDKTFKKASKAKGTTGETASLPL